MRLSDAACVQKDHVFSFFDIPIVAKMPQKVSAQFRYASKIKILQGFKEKAILVSLAFRASPGSLAATILHWGACVTACPALAIGSKQ